MIWSSKINQNYKVEKFEIFYAQLRLIKQSFCDVYKLRSFKINWYYLSLNMGVEPNFNLNNIVNKNE